MQRHETVRCDHDNATANMREQSQGTKMRRTPTLLTDDLSRQERPR